MPRSTTGIWEGHSKLAADTYIAGPLFSSPRRSVLPKRSRSKSPSRPPPQRNVRRRVTFEEGVHGGDDAIPPDSDESVIDGSDHTSGPHVDIARAARSGGGSRARELSSELFNSLQRADDPLMQQLGSFLSVSVTETADLRRHLAV